MVAIYGKHYLEGIVETLNGLQLSTQINVDTDARSFLKLLRVSNNLIGTGLILEEYSQYNKKLYMETLTVLNNFCTVTKRDITLVVAYKDKRFKKYLISQMGHRRLRVYLYKYEKDMLSMDNIKLEILAPIIKNNQGLYAQDNVDFYDDVEVKKNVIDSIINMYEEKGFSSLIQSEYYTDGSTSIKVFIDNLGKYLGKET